MFSCGQLREHAFRPLPRHGHVAIDVSVPIVHQEACEEHDGATCAVVEVEGVVFVFSEVRIMQAGRRRARDQADGQLGSWGDGLMGSWISGWVRGPLAT